MKLRLHSIEQAPASLPIWQLILDDLGNPPAHRIARTLGECAAHHYRLKAAEEAPRCAALALFWLTRWGQSHVNAQAVNDASMACNYVEGLTQEVARLRQELDLVLKLNGHGAANGPLMRVPK
jgi:hypothetical protein